MSEDMRYELPDQSAIYKRIENGKPWALIVCNENLWNNGTSAFMSRLREIVDSGQYKDILYVDVADLSFGTMENKRYMVLPNHQMVFEDGNLPIWAMFRPKERCEDFLMQQMGIKCYPSHESKEILDNKALGYSLFSGILNMPNCIYQAQNSLAKDLVPADFPYVLKTALGEGGDGVVKVETMRDVETAIQDLQESRGASGSDGVVAQKAVSDGSDTRVYVFGGKVYAAIRRQVSDGNWKANSKFDPIRKAVDLSYENRKMIENAVVSLGGENGFISFDFLQDDEGKMTLCEGNSNPGIDDLYICDPNNTLVEDYISYLNSMR